MNCRLMKAEVTLCFRPAASKGIESNQIEIIIQQRIIELRGQVHTGVS